MRGCSVRRALILGLLLAAGGRALSAQPPAPTDGFAAFDDGPVEFELGLSAGLTTDRGDESSTLRASEGIASGVNLSELIRRIYVYRSFRERVLLDIDYDASRSQELFFAEGDVYALHYLGRSGEFVRSASVGNRFLQDEAETAAAFAQPAPGEIGASVSGGRASERGEFRVDAMVRYGASDEVSIRFTGNRRVTDVRFLDVDHIRRTLYFLPDSSIDEQSLRLYRSTASAGDLTAGGVEYERLVRTIDFEYDSDRGWIFLLARLRPDQFLIACYEKDGLTVGSVALGTDAIIDETGARAHFNRAAFPGSFVDDGSHDYLVLADPDTASYWELRNAYRLPDPVDDGEPQNVEVSLLLREAGRANPAYDHLISRYVMNAQRRLIAFVFEDTVGFYPRPFPGVSPFTAASDPGNPFDPQNPIYGPVNLADEGAAVHVIRVRYEERVESYEIPDLFVAGSVRVSVDGVALRTDQFVTDEATGLVEIAPGVVGRQSEVVITYRLAADDASQRELHAAAVLRYDWARTSLGAGLSAGVPIVSADAPLLGSERPLEIGLAGEYVSRLLPDTLPGSLDLGAESAVRLIRPNAAGLARVADMSTSAPRSVSLGENDWMLASPSGILPILGDPIPLSDRGDLVYENYRETTFSGVRLRTIDWDNSDNRRFGYSEKAGPYNTDDRSPDGVGPSLVLDYSVPAGATEPYATVVTRLGGGLNRYDGLQLSLRAIGVTGAAVRLYVELLSTYQEDLNGNDVLDAQSGPDAPGLAITPVGGSPTVIGTDPYGEPDGRIATEDLNGNGRLDPAGPYASGAEVGVVVAGTGGDHAAEFAIGDTGWFDVDLDLEDIARTRPEVLDRATALRLTLVPLSDDARGIVLVNRLEFVSATVSSATPSLLELTRLDAARGGDLAEAPLAEAFPADYDALHGPSARRAAAGHREQALRMELLPPLAAGARAYAVTSVPHDSFTAYERLVLYFYRPVGQSVPTGLLVDVRIASGPDDYLGARIEASGLDVGWNRLEVTLAEGGEVRLNESAAGTTIRSGVGLRFSHRLEVGFVADGNEIAGGVVLWTDEWHVQGSRWEVVLAAGVGLEFSWPQALLSAGGLPVVGPARADVRYAVEVARDSLRHDVGASGEVALLRSTDLRSDWSRTTSNGSAPTGFESFEGEVGWSPSVAGLPVLRHGYAWTDDSGVAPDRIDRRQTRTLWFDAEVAPAERSTLGYAFERDLLSSERAATIGDTAEVVSTLESATMSDEHRLSVALADQAVRIDVAYLTRTESDEAASAARLGEGYGELISTLASDPVLIVASGRRVSERTQAGIAAQSSAERAVAFTGRASGALTERGVDLGAGPRAVTDEFLVAGSTPIRFGPVRVEPGFLQSITVRYGSVEATDAWSTVGPSLHPALMPPFWYLAPEAAWSRVNAVAALDGLVAAGSSSTTLVSEASISGSYRGDLAYVPGRFSTTVRSRIVQAGPVYRLTETQQLAVGKTVTLPGVSAVSVLSLDSRVGHEADLLTDARTLDLFWSIFYSSSRLDGSTVQLSGSGTWSRTRQTVGDPALVLFVDDPAREPVAARVDDSDRWDSAASISYVWRAERTPRSGSPLARRLAIDTEPQSVRNEERLVVETSHVVTESSSTPLTTMPLRITAEHSSEVRQTENLTVRLGLRAQGGYEQTTVGDGASRVASFGLEGSIAVVIRY